MCIRDRFCVLVYVLKNIYIRFVLFSFRFLVFRFSSVSIRLHGESKKHATLHSFITLANVLGDLKNSFTSELSKEFATLLV